jgi:hypothetical protein
MESQASRLLGLRGGGHGRRGSGGRSELIAEHGFDTKYAMHAARLGFQGLELLATRQLQLPIAGEPAEWLRAVRRGEVTFDDWWRRCLDLDAQLERRAADDSVPAHADRARIDAWSVRTHLAWWHR